MLFYLGLALYSLVFIVVFIIGCFLLFKKTWLLAWLRANAGMACLFFGISGGVGMYLLSDMQAMHGEIQFGQVQITPYGADAHVLKLLNSDVGRREVELIEDNWRLRAINISWTGILPTFGLVDGVILYDLQQTNEQGLTTSTRIEHDAVVEVWRFGRYFLQWLPGIQFEFLSTDWYPSNLNTVYDLRVTRVGLTLKDIKSPAKVNTAAVLFEPSNLEPEQEPEAEPLEPTGDAKEEESSEPVN